MEVRTFHKDGRPFEAGEKVPVEIQLELFKLMFGREVVEDAKELEKIA